MNNETIKNIINNSRESLIIDSYIGGEVHELVVVDQVSICYMKIKLFDNCSIETLNKCYICRGSVALDAIALSRKCISEVVLGPDGHMVGGTVRNIYYISENIRIVEINTYGIDFVFEDLYKMIMSQDVKRLTDRVFGYVNRNWMSST